MRVVNSSIHLVQVVMQCCPLPPVLWPDNNNLLAAMLLLLHCAGLHPALGVENKSTDGTSFDFRAWWLALLENTDQHAHPGGAAATAEC